MSACESAIFLIFTSFRHNYIIPVDKYTKKLIKFSIGSVELLASSQKTSEKVLCAFFADKIVLFDVRKMHHKSNFLASVTSDNFNSNLCRKGDDFE